MGRNSTYGHNYASPDGYPMLLITSEHLVYTMQNYSDVALQGFTLVDLHHNFNQTYRNLIPMPATLTYVSIIRLYNDYDASNNTLFLVF